MEIQVPYTTIDGRRRLAPGKNITVADHLIKFKKNAHDNPKVTGSPVWEVLEEVIKVWKSQRPTEYKSSIIDIRETKENLHDKKFATVDKKKTKGTGSLRRSLDVPMFVEMVMRRLYTIEELPFDKKWYVSLWDKVPMFRISDKN